MEGVASTSIAVSHAMHHVRITDHTKIKQYVSFCLKSLTENPSTTLVLHTLPNAGPRSNLPETEEQPKTKKRKLASSAKDIPRLISIAEIVKREFALLVLANKAGSGNPPGTVLHQYNVIDCLESPHGEQDEILLALEGKNHPKRNAAPYMKVYLSVEVREDLEKEGTTYQPPLAPPKKSKSARAREKKRLAKLKIVTETTGEANMD